MLIISISYDLLLLAVLSVGISRYKRLTIPFKVLTWSVLFIFLLAILSHVFVIRYKNNIPVMHLECITGYMFYSITYYYLFKNKTIKKFIVISMVIIIIFFIINAVFLQPFLKEFPSNVTIPTQVLYAVCSLLLFKEMLLYPLKINIIRQSVFWYNIGVLFYSTSLFLIFGLGNYLGEHKLSPNFVSFIAYFWYFVLYVFHVLIGVSLFIDNKEITVTDARLQELKA
jgi:hypothetical protein